MAAIVEAPSTISTSRAEDRFVWFDLMSTDRGASLTFFRTLLGWTASTAAAGSSGAYLTLSAGGVPFGGAMHMSVDEGHPSHFIGYVSCDDVDDVAARAPGLGGSVAFPPMDVPGVGRLAVLSDPTGAPFSAMTALPGTPQAPRADIPFGGVVWSEFVSRDPLRTGEFYARLFGWTLRTSSSPSAGVEDHALLTHGDTRVAGLSRAPVPGVRSGWLFYFRVADVAASAARVPQLGGAVVTAVMTTQNDGRVAIAREPTGATFALFQNTP